MTPRCSRVMLAYEAVHGALPEPPACGRPEGHGGPCRSVLALKRQRPKDLARSARWHRERRLRARQAQRRAVLAGALRGFDGYGRAA